MVLECKYCNKVYKTERNFLKHKCKKKERFEKKDSKEVRVGFNAYKTFYKFTTSATKDKTYEEFVNSPYYDAFVKFGQYTVDIKASNVVEFVSFLIKKGTPIDFWASDKNYTEFLNTLIKVEKPIDALYRTLDFSIKWSNKNNMDSNDMLKCGGENELCISILNGKISPWVLYNCKSGTAFLNAINKSQQNLIWDTIDPSFWTKKFDRHQPDVEYIKTTLTDIGW